LIIQKSISTRDKDWLDITELIHLRNKKIKWDYLLKHIDELAEFLSDPAISEKIREIRNEI
jgi:agmatine/peptidylarginine deiminase